MTGLQWFFVLEAALWLVGLITCTVLVCRRRRPHAICKTPLVKYSLSTSLQVGIPPPTVTKCCPNPGSPGGLVMETVTVFPNRQGTGVYWFTGVQRFGSISVIGVVVAYWVLVLVFALYDIWAARDTGLVAHPIYDLGRFPARWVQFAGYFCLVVLFCALVAGLREFYLILLLMISKAVQYFLWGSLEYALHQPLRAANPYFLVEGVVIAFAFLGGLAILVGTWYILIDAFIRTRNRFHLHDARVLSGQCFPEPASFALFVSAGVFELLIFLILMAQWAMRHTSFMVFEWSHETVYFAAVITIGITLIVAAIRATRRIVRRRRRGRKCISASQCHNKCAGPCHCAKPIVVSGCNNKCGSGPCHCPGTTPVKCQNDCDGPCTCVFVDGWSSDDSCSDSNSSCSSDDDKHGKKHKRHKKDPCKQRGWHFPPYVSMFSPLLIQYGFRRGKSGNCCIDSD